MQVLREKRLEELMDALERERLLRRHGVVPCIGSRVQNRILVRLPSPLNCLSPVKRQTCRLESLTASHPIIHPARPRTSSKRNEGMHEGSGRKTSCPLSLLLRLEGSLAMESQMCLTMSSG